MVFLYGPRCRHVARGAHLQVISGYPVTVNHAEFAAFARSVASEVVGEAASSTCALR